MTVKNTEKATSSIITNLVYDAVSVFHLGAEPAVFVLLVAVLTHAASLVAILTTVTRHGRTCNRVD